MGLNNGKLCKLSDVERTDDDPYCPITDMQRRLHHYKQWQKGYHEGYQTVRIAAKISDPSVMILSLA